VKALIVVDMLNDFIKEGGALYWGPDAREIIPFVARKIEEFRNSGDKVIYICDAHYPDDREFERFPPHSVKGTTGAEIIDELKPEKDDIVIFKIRYSVFYDTGLEDVLKKIAPETVHVAGVCTSICIMDTVDGLWTRGYKTVVYRDGVTDFDREAHEFALKRMESLYGAEVR